MRNTIETIPYVRERTFRDPTARTAVEWATHSEKKAKKPVFPPRKDISTVFFAHDNGPKVEGVSGIKKRVREIENILNKFNQKKKKRLNPEEKIQREQLLTELKINRQRLTQKL